MYDAFTLPKIKFPKDFLWGSASAAHQIEGDNTNNNYWRREQKGELEHKSGKACNSYVLYKEDIELLKSLGHKAYRFSVEWSRIEPSEGVFSQEATEHYVDMCKRLVEAGIQPWITLHHFTDPIWFDDKGGWTKSENIDCFLRFAEYIVPQLAPYAEGWTPINEYNLKLGLPPAPENHIASGTLKLHYLLADGRVYDVIKKYSQKPVGSSIAYVSFSPQRKYDTLDNVMTDYTDWVGHGFYYHAMRTGEWRYPFMESRYYPELKGKADFWAVNFYTNHMIDSRRSDVAGARYPHKRLRLIDKDFYHEEFVPNILMQGLERLKDKPIYITENGACCDDDRFRIVYMALHYTAFHHAISEGVDLRGIFHWSFMDNYEWGSYTPKFGLVACDLETFERTPKPSAMLYKDIIENNGFSGKTIHNYLDHLPSQADI